MTLFFRRTGSINLDSLLREIFIVRLLCPHIWGGYTTTIMREQARVGLFNTCAVPRRRSEAYVPA